MANQRRKRFVMVGTKAGRREEQHILAYSEPRARVVAAQLGYEIESIRPYVKGEYFKEPENSGFRISALNLRTAERILGLTWPVVIRKTGHKGGRRGAYRPIQQSGRRAHRITLKSWLDPVQVGKTLWHELRHARQAEDIAARNVDWSSFLSDWHATYRDGTAYRDKWMEREARETEAMNDIYPLGKPL